MSDSLSFDISETEKYFEFCFSIYLNCDQKPFPLVVSHIPVLAIFQSDAYRIVMAVRVIT